MARVAVAAQQRAAVGMGYVCVARFMAAADRQESNTCSMQPAAQASTGQLIAAQTSTGQLIAAQASTGQLIATQASTGQLIATQASTGQLIATQARQARQAGRHVPRCC
jgi:hypothetical protein